jgi:hypothetical protein
VGIFTSNPFTPHLSLCEWATVWSQQEKGFRQKQIGAGYVLKRITINDKNRKCALMQKELMYEDIQIEDTAVFSKTISVFDVYQFAGLTGDFNPDAHRWGVC